MIFNCDLLTRELFGRSCMSLNCVFKMTTKIHVSCPVLNFDKSHFQPLFVGKVRRHPTFRFPSLALGQTDETNFTQRTLLNHGQKCYSKCSLLNQLNLYCFRHALNAYIKYRTECRVFPYQIIIIY